MLATGNILVISSPPNDSYQLDEPSFEVEHQGSECQPHQGSDYGVKDMSIDTSTDDVTSVRSVKSGTSSGSDLDSLSYGIAIDLLEEKTQQFEAKLEDILDHLTALEQRFTSPDVPSTMFEPQPRKMLLPVQEESEILDRLTALEQRCVPPDVPSTMFESQQHNTSLPVQQESHTVDQSLIPMPQSVTPLHSHMTIEQVKIKYHKFHSVGKIGSMAVKLCREAIFGDEIMKKSTVKGCRNLPPLPEDGLRVLKETLFSLFPQYWESPTSFEPLWTTSLEAVGQCCKQLRNPK